MTAATLETAIALAGNLNDAVDQALSDAEQLLRLHGSTPEFDAFMGAFKKCLSDWRSRTFDELWAQLQRIDACAPNVSHVRLHPDLEARIAALESLLVSDRSRPN